VARHLAVLALLAVSVYFVLPQLATAGATVGTVGRFKWSWLPAIALAGTATYAMAALSLMAAAGGGLRFRRTMPAQLAAAFTNRLLPAGVGAMATNVRYMERAGLSRRRAATAVGLDSVAGFLVHAVALLAVSALFHSSHQPFRIGGPDLPDHWSFLVLVAGLLSVVGVVLEVTRHRWLGPLRGAARPLADLARHPGRGARLLAASAGVTGAFILALYASVLATGAGVSLLAVSAAYLGGSALAAAAPTPGGLGAVEAGLIAGLIAVGEPAAAAVTAVLVFRIVTYWAPVLPGAVSFWALRRAGAL
jgi:undecaprenyl-diphosphatase